MPAATVLLKPLRAASSAAVARLMETRPVSAVEGLAALAGLALSSGAALVASFATGGWVGLAAAALLTSFATAGWVGSAAAVVSATLTVVAIGAGSATTRGALKLA